MGGGHGEPGKFEKERGEIRRLPQLGECRGAEATQEQETRRSMRRWWRRLEKTGKAHRRNQARGAPTWE